MNRTGNKWKSLSKALAGLAVLTFLDQWTKWMAIRYLANAEDIILLPGVFQLHYLENRGAAFGILQNQQWVFVVIAAVFLLTAGLGMIKLPDKRRYFPLRLLLIVAASGALGNVIDRIARGFVVDFLYFSLIDFPVFNVADIYVVVSCICLFLLVTFYYKEEEISSLVKRKGDRS